MGLFDRFTSRRTVTTEAEQPQTQRAVVGVDSSSDTTYIQSFDNSNFTFSGDLSGYDYISILKDKQNNIQNFYQLADYFADADPIIHGIIYHVFVPFSTCSDWYLTGAKKKTCAMYEEQYKTMRLREKVDSIFLEAWKYSNVCCYLYKGDLITLPPTKWKIGNTMFNGTPIVDYDCQSILNEIQMKSYSIKETYVKDSQTDYVLKGYPEEIQKAVKNGEQYAQLNPDNTFVLQGSKATWQRYAIPFIASALRALAKKELISSYEDAMLNIGKRSFVHVKYGESSKINDVLPDQPQLAAIRKIFLSAMSGTPLAVTNHLATAEAIQFDMDDLFQWDKYRGVNRDILSAGGISEVMVTGVSDDGSAFSAAQISTETAEARINAMRDEFCEMMNKINKRLTEFIPGTYNLKETPEFHFQPLSIEGKKALRETALALWEKGVVSTDHMLKTHGYSIDVEKENRQKEKSDGTDEILISRESTVVEQSNENVGRPEIDDSDRKSDPASSERGKQPKPSNPEGSMKT